MEDKLISVVVPIYNVEKYLRQCVDSILRQTYKNLEVILVDDGSPDNCPEICDEYAKKDARVKVIHKPNGGVGTAYNAGIQSAMGDYIGLVESDDWIEPNMYQLLLESALKFDSDLVKCNFYNYDSFAKKQCRESGKHSKFFWNKLAPDNKSFSIKEYSKLMIPHPSIWAALYKKDLIKKISFVETKSAAYQDYPFMMEAFFTAQKISVVHKALLNYRQEMGNQSSTNRSDRRLMVMADQTMFIYEKLHNHPNFSQCIEEFVQSAVSPNYCFYQNIDEEYKVEYFEKLKETFAFLKQYPQLTYKYASAAQKKFVHAILTDNIQEATQPVTKSYFGGLLKKEKYKNCKKVYLFGKLVCTKKR